MAREKLKDMIEALRAEIGASLSPGHNISQDSTHRYVLSRVQRELYLNYDWTHLLTEERVTVSAGERYTPALTLVDYEQINEVWCSYGSEWIKLGFDFGPEHYSAYDPQSGDRGYPVLRYRPYFPNEAVELWPIPSQDVTLIVKGQRALTPLKSPDDMSVLDGTLIVLFAAADIMADLDRDDAARKSAKATAYLRAVRANLQSHKKRVTSLIPDRNPPLERLRPGLDYIPEGTT